MSWYAIAMTSEGDSNMWTQYQEGQKAETIDGIAEGLMKDTMGTMMGAVKSPISTLKSLGILSPYTAYDVGQEAFVAEFQHGLDEWSAPWTAFWRDQRSNLEGMFGPYYYQNRMGGYIGKQVGGAIGWIVGLWFPALQPLFVELFGEAGGFLGTFIQAAATGPYDHPNIPGSPGEIPEPDAPYVPPYHDPSWFVDAIPPPPPVPSLVPPRSNYTGYTRGRQVRDLDWE